MEKIIMQFISECKKRGIPEPVYADYQKDYQSMLKDGISFDPVGAAEHLQNLQQLAVEY